MSLSPDLSGKVALVTGASGSLGGHFARLLARHGAIVAIAARRLDALEALAADLETAGRRAFPIHLDVTSADSARRAVAEIERQVGPVDILVNNSGTAVAKSFLDQTEEDWDRVLNTNLKGAFLVGGEVARQMRRLDRPGSIINIASILGLRQTTGSAGYAVSKAGLVQLTKIMALELARYRIRVNAIAPGYIATDLNRDFFETEAGAALIKRVPQRRLGLAEELDGVLLLLASDSSRFMTGSVIVADGGLLTCPV
jgi:NAD(P)-dependent dehydrogenase (short-subunit alcohol dehydrogenase family)